jgi:hypothetical protein
MGISHKIQFNISFITRIYEKQARETLDDYLERYSSFTLVNSGFNLRPKAHYLSIYGYSASNTQKLLKNSTHQQMVEFD